MNTKKNINNYNIQVVPCEFRNNWLHLAGNVGVTRDESVILWAAKAGGYSMCETPGDLVYCTLLGKYPAWHFDYAIVLSNLIYLDN